MSENPIITQLTPIQQELIPDYRQIILPKLTPEQQALIPVYRDKWLKIALSTERIDEEKVTEAIKAAYRWFDIEKPEIVFFDNPYKAFRELNELGYDSSFFSILSNLRHPLEDYPYKVYRFTNAIEQRTEIEQSIVKLSLEINFNLYTQVLREVEKIEETFNVGDDEFDNAIHNNSLIAECCFYDFCISVLKLPHNKKKWQTFKNIIEHCGWMFDLCCCCLISNRPTSLSFDEQNQLHATENPQLNTPIISKFTPITAFGCQKNTVIYHRRNGNRNGYYQKKTPNLEEF